MANRTGIDQGGGTKVTDKSRGGGGETTVTGTGETSKGRPEMIKTPSHSILGNGGLTNNKNSWNDVEEQDASFSGDSGGGGGGDLLNDVSSDSSADDASDDSVFVDEQWGDFENAVMKGGKRESHELAHSVSSEEDTEEGEADDSDDASEGVEDQEEEEEDDIANLDGRMLLQLAQRRAAHGPKPPTAAEEEAKRSRHTMALNGGRVGTNSSTDNVGVEIVSEADEEVVSEGESDSDGGSVREDDSYSGDEEDCDEHKSEEEEDEDENEEEEMDLSRLDGRELLRMAQMRIQNGGEVRTGGKKSSEPAALTPAPTAARLDGGSPSSLNVPGALERASSPPRTLPPSSRRSSSAVSASTDVDTDSGSDRRYLGSDSEDEYESSSSSDDDDDDYESSEDGRKKVGRNAPLTKGKSVGDILRSTFEDSIEPSQDDDEASDRAENRRRQSHRSSCGASSLAYAARQVAASHVASEDESGDGDSVGSDLPDNSSMRKGQQAKSTMEDMLKALPQDEERNIQAPGETEDDALDAQSVRSYGAALLKLAESSRASRLNKKFSTGYHNDAMSLPASSGVRSYARVEHQRSVKSPPMKRAQRRDSGGSRGGFLEQSGSLLSRLRDGHAESSPPVRRSSNISSAQMIDAITQLEENQLKSTSPAGTPALPPRTPANEIVSPALVQKVPRQDSANSSKDSSTAPFASDSFSFAPSASFNAPKNVERASALPGVAGPGMIRGQRSGSGEMQQHGPRLPSRGNQSHPSSLEESPKSVEATGQPPAGSAVESLSGRLIVGARKWWQGRQQQTKQLDLQREVDLHNRRLSQARTDSLRNLGRKQDSFRGVQIEPEPVAKQGRQLSVPHILGPSVMSQMAKDHLPATIKFSRWKRLYSLARDGDSFDTFLRQVENEPRTLLVIRTTREDVLGAYADSPWEMNHNEMGMERTSFYGSTQAFLFKLMKDVPSKKQKEVLAEEDGRLFVYTWKGNNRYMQLCDHRSKVVAMGGGGEGGTFGLSLGDDFNRGSSGWCETFENDPLASTEQFDVLDMEVWGFVSMYS